MKLYQPGTKEFNTNGLGTIKDIIGRPEVRQKLNGFFDLVIEVSVLERLYDQIENEAVVVADTPKGPQPFIIYTTEPGLKSKKVYARHLLQRWLERDFVEDTNIVGKTGVNALAQLLEKSVVDNSWISVTGDNSTINSSRLVRKNLLEALIGSENNSIINRFGGELDYQYPSIIYNQEIGQNNGVTVKHRKNLNGYTAKIDTSNLVTRIMPQGFDGLFLPEKYIKSNLEDTLGFISIQKVEFSDIKADTSEYAQEDGLPLEEAYEALRTRSKNLLNELSQPKVQIDVDFIDLAKTEQYAQFENLERVNLGDYVQFIHDDFNVELQVTEYTYNPLLHRMTQVTLGEVETSFMLAFRTITKVNQEINLLRDAQPNILKAAKDSATNLIASGFGGFVKYYPDRILIMDTEDEASAKNVWQWNKNGLGFSSTGVAGLYGLAMTSDGQIVADFITTGGLSANRIVSGLLQSADGGTWINMDNGSFSFGDGAVTFNHEEGLHMSLTDTIRQDIENAQKYTWVAYTTSAEQNITDEAIMRLSENTDYGDVNMSNNHFEINGSALKLNIDHELFTEGTENTVSFSITDTSKTVTNIVLNGQIEITEVYFDGVLIPPPYDETMVIDISDGIEHQVSFKFIAESNSIIFDFNTDVLVDTNLVFYDFHIRQSPEVVFDSEGAIAWGVAQNIESNTPSTRYSDYTWTEIIKDSDIEKKSSDFIFNSEELKVAFNSISDNGEKLSQISKYLSFNAETGEIVLGESDSPVQWVQTNEKVSFVAGGVELASWTTEEMKVKRLTVDDLFVALKIYIGNHIIEKYGNDKTIVRRIN